MRCKAVCLLMALSLMTVASAPAWSAASGPGCGIGSVVLRGTSGLFFNVWASLLNNLMFSNQTFGMSSGTLGCDGDAVVQNDRERREFITYNLDELEREAAQGGGIHMATLAHMMAIEQDQQPAFFRMVQAQYDQIFTNDAPAQEVLAKLDYSWSVAARE